MKNFRYIYGFLILAILVSGLYIKNITILMSSLNSINNHEQTVKNGLPEPRGKYILGEIIKTYDLNKEKFYDYLHLPMDFPENRQVIMLIRYEEISYSDINGYMELIIEEFEKK